MAFTFFIIFILTVEEIPVIEVEGEVKREEVLQIVTPSPQKDSIAELLSDEPGITMRRYGGEGSLSLLSIRGTPPSQTEFFFEGIPISLTPYSSINIEDLPLQGIGKIEIAKEIIPSEFSAASIGGIVNIVPPVDGKPLFHYLSGNLSSYETMRFSGYTKGNSLSHSYFFYLDTFHTDGDFIYKNSNGTPFNPCDDYYSKRENNKTDRIEFLGRFAYFPSAFISSISLTMSIFSKDQGIPGTDVLQAFNSKLKERRGIFVGEIKMEGEKFSLGIQPFTGLNRESFSDRDNEIGLWAEEVKQNFLLSGLRLKGNTKKSKRFLPAFSLIYSHSIWDSDFIIPEVRSFHASRDEARFSIDTGINISKRLYLLPQISFYYSITEGEGLVPSFGFKEKNMRSSYILFMPSISSVIKFSKFSVLLTLGKYVRVPSLFELLGDRGVWMGNPDLKPEKGLKGSVEWNGAIGGNLKFSSAIFFRYLNDMISYVQNSQFTFRPENISSAFILGFESGFSGKWKKFTGGGNYTFLFTEDRGEIGYLYGKTLPLQPSHELHSFLDWKFLDGVSFRYEFDLRGRTFLDRANMREIKAKTNHSVYLRKEFKIHDGKNEPMYLSILGYIKNIFNDQQFDIYGIPLPGREVGVKVGIQM